MDFRVGWLAVVVMPFTYTIDREREAVFYSATGVLTDEIAQDLHSKIFQDPDFHPHFRVLGDYSGVSELQISAVTIASLAARSGFSKQSRRALLTQYGIISGTALFYTQNTPPGNARIFYDRAKALAWLNEGVPPEKVIT